MDLLILVLILKNKPLFQSCGGHYCLRPPFTRTKPVRHCEHPLLLPLFGIKRTTKDHGHFYTLTTLHLVDDQSCDIYIYIYIYITYWSLVLYTIDRIGERHLNLVVDSRSFLNSTGLFSALLPPFPLLSFFSPSSPPLLPLFSPSCSSYIRFTSNASFSSFIHFFCSLTVSCVFQQIIHHG